MNRNSLKSSGRAAGLAVFLLGLFLPAAARAQGDGQAPVQTAEHKRDHRVWLRIMAFTDAPVMGADVSVRDSHGLSLVDVKAATNDQGVFTAAVQSYPSSVRITVSGGTINGESFHGYLTADVELTDPAHQILVVNPVTTLVSLVLDGRPELSLHRAEALVRRFLKLPANYSLGLALRQSSGYASPFFSPVAFMREARDTGGLDAFEHLLGQELVSDSAIHSFRNPTALAAEGINVGQELTTNALSYFEGQGLGWVMAQTGLVTPGATEDDIHALQQQLQNIQSSLDNLSSQVANLSNLLKSTATQTQYITITTTAQNYANTITGHEADLDAYVQKCPPLAEDATPPTTVDPYCTTTKPIVISELQTEFTSKYYEIVEGYIKDNGALGTEGMLHLYSLWLGESRPFFRAADSAKMQALYDYWDGVLTSAANLRMEWFHYLNYQDPNSPAGNATITQFIGNPDLSPPPGTFQVDEATNAKLMFPAVPNQTVVTTQDHTMWSLLPWGWSPSCPVPNCFNYKVSPSAQCALFVDPALKIQQKYPNGFIDCCISKSPFAGFSDWEPTASKPQWQALVQPAPANTTWQNWLIQQTRTTGDEMPASPGFFNEDSVCYYYSQKPGSPPSIWTSTVDHYSGQSPVNWTINLDANRYDTQTVTYAFGSPNPDLPAWPARTLAAGEQYFWYQ